MDSGFISGYICFVNHRILFILVMIAALAGCRREKLPIAEGELEFSSDTIRFDSIFSGFLSPSERLIAWNNTDHDMLVNRVYFENGENSEFDLILDGVESDDIVNYEVPQDDSIHIFIRMKSTVLDDFASDKLIFEIGGEKQEILILGFNLDAHFYKDFTIPSNGWVMPYDKPVVIDGAFIVPDGWTMNIGAGTQIYFTPRQDDNYNLISRIDVYGRLEVWGEKGKEVVFQQTRLDEDYLEFPGQWRGIRFLQPSNNSTIRHALIKNALVGVEVQQPPGNVSFKPKVLMDAVEIRNMSAYGIFGIGYADLSAQPLIHAINTLVHNCAEYDVIIYAGGKYVFDHCTFANYDMDFNRNTPLLGINNYDEDASLAFKLDAKFRNCIIFGSEEDEVVLDDAGVGFFDVVFTNCIVRAKETTIPGTGNLISQNETFINFFDPRQYKVTSRDYRLASGSPAIDAGIDVNVNDDILNHARDASPDAGCYEF